MRLPLPSSCRAAALAAALAAGCGAAGDDPGACPTGLVVSAASAPDRSLLGPGSPYPADPTLSAQADAIDRSQRVRRAVAWEVMARVLEPVTIAGRDRLEHATVARFRTWYDREDLTRIFQGLYADLGPAGRSARARFPEAALDAAFRRDVSHVDTLPAWTPTRWRDYLGSLHSPEALVGVGGLRRVLVSPDVARHLVRSYPEVLGCLEGAVPPAIADGPAAGSGLPGASGPCGGRGLQGGSGSRRAPSQTTGATCLDGVFPLGSATVSMDWRRADAGWTLPVYDSTGPAIARRYATGRDAAWGPGDAVGSPSPAEIYTMQLPAGTRFRLAGMHIRTRELGRWLNITLWYSDTPDSDFGADRPVSIQALGAPWTSYKLCVTTDFDEGDPRPDGGFARAAPSLAEALRAVHEGAGGPSWCSNPYIDAGPGLVRSNCVGCHQHAMTGVRPAQTVGDEARYPRVGRAQVRNNFPTDMFWGLDAGDNFAAVFAETASWWRSGP